MDGRNAWWLRRSATARVIADVAPDVAGLQEVRPLQLRYLRRRLPQYRFLSKGRAKLKGKGEHCPILCRRDRLDVRSWDVQWFAPGSPDRIVTVAHFDSFSVANTHLAERSGPAREASVAALLGWIGGSAKPWIVMGDLNATPADPPVRALLDAGLRDVLADLPSAGPGAATGHEWTGKTDGRRIDHILVSPQFEVLDASIVRAKPGGRLPSDHWPVVARLRLTERE
jgi:endonuclease/exonuclease/phosphatase family metal-dependent hydrolase